MGLAMPDEEAGRTESDGTTAAPARTGYRAFDDLDREDDTADTPLTEREEAVVATLQKTIDQYFDQIPRALKDEQTAIAEAMEFLLKAQMLLKPPVSRSRIIGARIALTHIEILIQARRSGSLSTILVAAIIYLIAIVVAVASVWNFMPFVLSQTPHELNQIQVLGIPMPVLIWSMIGSLTSMLIRAGNFPFTDTNAALRWLMYRPITGIVMGVLTYLMVTAGLIVFAGQTDTTTPQLIWIIAFIGSFSDTLSINLLQKLVGQFAELKPRKQSQPPQDDAAAGDPPSAPARPPTQGA